MKKNIALFGRLFFLFLFMEIINVEIVDAQNTIRYATAADAKVIANANIGDLLITGGTEESDGLPAVWIGPTDDWPLGPGKKILINNCFKTK